MSVILSLVKEIKHVKGLFVAGLVLLLLATAGAQLAPLILQHLIDHNLTDVSKGLVLDQGAFLTQLAFFAGAGPGWTLALRFLSGPHGLCQSGGD